jgi:hypothetical protein
VPNDNQKEYLAVIIAAYRDPQLIATVADCTRKSRGPAHLRFGICRQHAPMRYLFPLGTMNASASWTYHFGRARALIFVRSLDAYNQSCSLHGTPLQNASEGLRRPTNSAAI